MKEFLQWAKRELTWLRQRLERIDAQQKLVRSSSEYLIVIDQGNTLEEGSTGINYYEGTLTSVPEAYDPNVTTSFMDGIGRGTLYKDNVAQDGYVLVINDDHGSFRNALFQGDPIRTSGAVSIPVAGGGTVRAYTAGT
jgi:hypothetical protein